MLYVLVMGGLALSVCFTLGWLLVRGGQWLWRRRPGGGGPPRRQTRKAATQPARKPALKPRRPAKSAKSTGPVEPWGLTRWLAGRRSLLPLTLLALVLYGFARLAEHGLSERSHEVPQAYHALVVGLGWGAVTLSTLTALMLLAVWRCRGER